MNIDKIRGFLDDYKKVVDEVLPSERGREIELELPALIESENREDIAQSLLEAVTDDDQDRIEEILETLEVSSEEGDHEKDEEDEEDDLDDEEDEQLSQIESDLSQTEVRPNHIQATRSKNLSKLKAYLIESAGKDRVG